MEFLIFHLKTAEADHRPQAGSVSKGKSNSKLTPKHARDHIRGQNQTKRKRKQELSYTLLPLARLTSKLCGTICTQVLIS